MTEGLPMEVPPFFFISNNLRRRFANYLQTFSSFPRTQTSGWSSRTSDIWVGNHCSDLHPSSRTSWTCFLAGPAGSLAEPPDRTHHLLPEDRTSGWGRPTPVPSTHPPDTGGASQYRALRRHPTSPTGNIHPTGASVKPQFPPRKLSECLHLGISVDFIFHNISYFSKKPLYFEKHPFSKYRKNTALRKYLFLGYL